MTTYYVDKASGSDGATGLTGHPWATIGKATSAVAGGDTVKIKPGTYYEQMIITKGNTTWTVDGNGSSPVVLDGRYSYATAGNGDYLKNPSDISAAKPRDKYGAMIEITAAGVTIDGVADYGFYVRNSAGRFIKCSGNNGTIKHLRGDFCYTHSVSSQGTDGFLLEDCALTRVGMINWGPEKDKGKYITPVSITVRNSTNATFRRVYLAYASGEGLVAEMGSDGILIQDCEVHNMAHVHCYVNGSRNAVVDGCIIWSDPYVDRVNRTSTGSKRVSTGVTFGDEKSSGKQARNPKVYNCLVVGLRDAFQIRGSTTPDTNYAWAMTDFYFGYNTVIGYRPNEFNDHLPEVGSRTLVDIDDCWDSRSNGTPHGGIVENNIFMFMDGQTPAEGAAMTRLAGNQNITFRNNVWHQPPATNVRGTGDYYGSPELSNQKYVLPRTNYNRKAADCPIIRLGDDTSWAELIGSSRAVGRASNGSKVGTHTPPTITVDLNNAARDSHPDCGAFEYGGTVPEPEDTLTANFTKTANGGVVPLTVNFTDTSVSTGTKNWWLWSFGDGGTSASQNPSHIYNVAGVYTPTLTVRDNNGLQATKTGGAITVTAQGDTGGGGGDEGTGSTVAAVNRVALSTSTGNQAVAVDLGGLVPALVLAFTSRATAVGTPAADAMMCIGAWTSVRQKAHVVFSEDNVSPSNAARVVDSSIAVWLNESGIVGNARVASVAADLVTLDVTDAFPVGGLCTIVAFAGSQFDAAVDHLTMPGNGGTVRATGGDLMLLFSDWTGTTVTEDVQMSLGAATAAAQGHTAFRELSGEASTILNTTTGIGSLAHYWDGNTRAYVAATNIENGTLAVSGGNVDKFATVVSMRVSDGYAFGQFMTPAGTGNVSYNIGFEPTFVLFWGSLNPGVGGIANNNVNNNAFWVAVVGPDGATKFTGFSITDSAATTETQSNAENTIKIYSGAGSVQLAGTLTVDSDGFDINWTTARTTAINYIAIEGGTAAPTPNLPVAAFTGTPTTIDEGGTVAFQNNTNSNGAAVTGYEWDFGDGETSTETSPVHVYLDAGPYTVTLTVSSTGNDDVILEKVGYITVTYTPQEIAFVNPWFPLDITEDTTSQLHIDANDEDNLGFIEFGLNLSGVEISLDPPNRQVKTGKVWLYATSAEDGTFVMKAQDAAGNVYTGPTYTED